MRLLCLTLLIVCPFAVAGQCLTDFNKLVPTPTTDITQQFGRISMFGNYLAIGLPENDSLGRLAGIVKIYERSLQGWKSAATLAPSDPVDALQFGVAVKLSSNYLLVAAGSSARRVYVFKKPALGWQSQTQMTTFRQANGQLFGVPYQTQNTMAISADEQTIAISDPFYTQTGENMHGAVFVYHKQPVDEWNGSMEPVMLRAPEDDAPDFGRAGVFIEGNRVITGTPFAPTANGRLYVFKDPTGEFLDLQLEAKLSAYGSNKTAFLGYADMAVTAEGIITTITIGMDTSEPRNVVAFYEFPASGDWYDTDYTCVFPYHPEPIRTGSFPSMGTNGTDIVVSSREGEPNKTGYTTLIRKGPSGWCDPVLELVDTSPLRSGQYDSNYGSITAVNQSRDIAVGVLPHPQLAGANLALKVMTRNLSGDWEAQLLSGNGKSSAGHWYGRAILGFEDYLFVGASGDGSLKPNGGAVYVYKKSGNNWSQTGKVVPHFENRYDDVFGSALATNGKQLAVGAIGFEEHGRVFVYRKNDADWSDPELVQEIELPEDILTVFSYGDNLAMNDEWLLIPYVQNNPARILIAAYKYNGTEWVYSQVIEVGVASLFAKSTTMAVAIDGNTAIAGSVVLELDAENVWHKTCALSPSDPENPRIAPDFSHWVSNGSSFGHAVAISENTIFIAAPTKDDGATWDVGAVYVYSKKPMEPWSNRTETVKILPRVRNEGELFGYSLKAIGNTLIAGAPGADYNRDGAARNKPGRVYIFQTKDYFWTTVTPLLDLTGDSFVKDYFGIAVSLDETDFFISAPIEDLKTGKLSGSVYITPAPPIVKLVAPVCSSLETIDLFGYPFGGTWSGPGIIDAAAGIFDPKAAGVGEHEFMYKTASCTYVGRLRIRVEKPVSPVLLSANDEYFVCQQAAVQIPLAVQPVSGYQYLWYHRDDPGEPFFPLNQKQPTMTATSRGEYKVKIFSAACESFSSAIAIRNDNVELVLDPVGRICADASEGVVLLATPQGGHWYGQGVSMDGKLFTKSLANGTRTLTYRYTSPRQCPYEKSMQYQLDRLGTPSIKRLGGNLCREGAVDLGISPPVETDVAYSWLVKRRDDDEFGGMDVSGHSIAVNEPGLYQVMATDGQCYTVSNQIAVDDATFPLQMLPADNDIVVCEETPLKLETQHAGEGTYEWYFANGHEGPGVRLQGQGQKSLTVAETGYYYAVVRLGICTQETPRKHVTFKPDGEIFVPNVMTSNGDGFNDVFEIESSMDILGVRIMNRYGVTIFTSDAAENKWTGENSAAGVYYWLVDYRACTGEVRTVKGWVHLIN